MKSLIFLVAAVVLAVCFYLFAPLSFIHGSGFVAKVVYGALFVIPTIMAINPITNSAAEGSFLNKYGIGIAAIGAVLISIFTFGQIKDSKTDAAITKNGARTIAILKDAHKDPFFVDMIFNGKNLIFAVLLLCCVYCMCTWTGIPTVLQQIKSEHSNLEQLFMFHTYWIVFVDSRL